MPGKTPFTIAIVGRPNVGKSTLFNRIAGRRRAIVGDEPGITRDRIYATAEWNGRALRVIDTGGMLPHGVENFAPEIFEQARAAIAEADAVVLVVDGRAAITAPDMELARMLRRSGKPLFLAVNKMDSPKLYPEAEEFRRLGIGELFPVSAEHGTGVAELLDAIVAKIPTRGADEREVLEKASGSEEKSFAAAKNDRETRIAIIGRPNVGKSTLLNQLTKSSRAIVSPIPGTTRDAVDEVVERGGRGWRFVDTAGIRRKGKTRMMAEKLAVVMARKHLESADIALLVVDATEGVTASDATIAGYAHESGRSVMVLANKWDLILNSAAGMAPRDERRAQRTGAGMVKEGEAARRAHFEDRTRAALKFLSYAPVVFVSAAKGAGMEALWRAIEAVARERAKRISTGEMNRFLKHMDFSRAPAPAAHSLRIYYMTQAATAPPTFILFTNRNVKLHFSQQRYFENQIRREFGFAGTPIRLKLRPKKQRA